MSTESIADPPGAATPEQPAAPPAAPAERCASCGAPLAGDQRYCLECGERRAGVSNFLLAGAGAASAPSTASPPSTPPPELMTHGEQGAQRSSWLSTIAFVGVLLLAMGVGVLIGRAGNSKVAALPPQVVTVEPGPSGSTSSSEASFTSDWPSGRSGYTVQLQTLPVSGSSVSAVQSAKSSATAKGAKEVGALKSEEFSSLTGDDYVIYSGDYRSHGEAAKALSSLKSRFPGASVIHVSGGSGGSSAAKSGASGTGSSGGVGSSPSKPAPPSVLKHLGGSHGKKYEEESKNLPDVVETG